MFENTTTPYTVALVFSVKGAFRPPYTYVASTAPVMSRVTF